MSLCSECSATIPPRKKTGRIRDTCSPKCATARSARRKREKRAWLAECRKADAVNEAYLRDEFRPWLAGKGWPIGGGQ